ncbi:hypothetical protein D3C71_1551440 [compost metagenome]
MVGMRIVQRIGDPCSNREHGGDGQQRIGTACMGQVTAFEKLHGNVGKVALFARVKNRHDVGVLQASGRLGFPKKAGAGVN